MEGLLSMISSVKILSLVFSIVEKLRSISLLLLDLSEELSLFMEDIMDVRIFLYSFSFEVIKDSCRIEVLLLVEFSGGLLRLVWS